MLSHKHGYQVHFSVRVGAGMIQDTVMGPFMLPERLSAQQYHDFLEPVLPGLPEAVL
jgi:hypothetical protein